MFFVFVFLNVHSSSESRCRVVSFTNQKVDGLISGSFSLRVEVSLSKILNPVHPSGVRMLQGYKLFGIEKER